MMLTHPLEKALDCAVAYGQSLDEPWGPSAVLPLTIAGMAMAFPGNEGLAAIHRLVAVMDDMGCPCGNNEQKVHVVGAGAHPMVHLLGRVVAASMLDAPEDPITAVIHEASGAIANFIALCILHEAGMKLHTIAEEAHRAGFPIAAAFMQKADPSFDVSRLAPRDH